MKMQMPLCRCSSPIILSVLSIAIAIASCGAFNLGPYHRMIATATRPKLRLQLRPPLSSSRTRTYVTTRDPAEGTSPITTSGEQKRHPALSDAPLEIRLEACASSGIECSSDLPLVLDIVASVCEEYGVSFTPLDNDDDENDNIECQCEEAPFRSESTLGALGRVLLVRVHGVSSSSDINDHDILQKLKMDMSQRIDAALHANVDISNKQPILLAFHPIEGVDTTMGDAIEKEIMDYKLKEEVNDVCSVEEDSGCFVHPYQFYIYSFPSSHVEIDGKVMMMEDTDGGQQRYFDTSSILVFDKILDDKKLQKRLLNVVKGLPENNNDAEECENESWNDVKNGPDPKRWVRNRGGPSDAAEETSHRSNNNINNGETTSSWRLTDDAITDICYNDHPAVAEFESKLAQLFPDFAVTRLPEAIFGPRRVPSLTANASTSGEDDDACASSGEYEYRIDADPRSVPPSPWTDVYGRYPNRTRGKPRFVTCILYLNDEWDAQRWGGPARFLDSPSKETYDVSSKPGRCVIVDGDVARTTIAPKGEAGKRPLYSLVWKLILHPTLMMEEEGRQDMDLSCGKMSLWPEAEVVGSANRM